MPKELADRLAQERRLKSVAEWRDVKHSEIANGVGTSGSNVSKWEAGKTMPSDDALRRLAAYYGVNVGWLRYGEGEREAPPAMLHQPTDAQVAALDRQRQAARKRGRKRA